ncbi:MAG: hypothetical protein QOG03_2243 [Actinomycetota bacterium]|nr:hypothetical protein [Actinomycetota bacterium]
MTETGHVPGWYADPDGGNRLRYWDGRGWTEQRRELPEWGHATGDGPPPPKARRWFSITIAVAAIVGVIITALVMRSVGQRPPRTIHDAAFERQADALCKTRLTDLRPARSDPEGPPSSVAPVVMGGRIDKTADEIAATAAALRALPVNESDHRLVEAWLADWDEYAAVGHRYADAVRGGDPRTYTKVEAQGHDPVHRIGRFARGNHIDHCVL